MVYSISREMYCRVPDNSLSQGLKTFFIIIYLTKIPAAVNKLTFLSLFLEQIQRTVMSIGMTPSFFPPPPKDFLLCNIISTTVTNPS